MLLTVSDDEKSGIKLAIDKQRVNGHFLLTASTVRRDAFKHIAELQQKSAKRVLGVVLYGGETVLAFGEGEFERYAVPFGVFF